MQDCLGLNRPMRIDEITVPKGKSQAVYLLHRAGYHVMGHPGAFGTVMRKPGSPYVVKLYEANDRAYTTFAEFCRTTTNPYFPRIIGRIVEVTPHYRAVRLEPLSSPRDEYGATRFLMACEDYIMGRSKIDDDTWSLMEDHPELKEACLALRTLMSEHALHLDLYFYNLMVRGDQYVFIDPVKNAPFD